MRVLAGAPGRPRPGAYPDPPPQFRIPAERRALAVILILGVALPVAISAALGSFGLPSVDDWSYRRVAVEFAGRGHLEYGGWVSMTFIGQALWAWPFLRVLGDHGGVLDASTILLAVVGLTAAYWLARQLLPRPRAVAAVLLLLGAPGLLLNTSTFMTDVPALAAELLSLALGVAALRTGGRRRVALMAGCMAAGLFGFSIREFDIVAPVAVLGCAAASDRSPRRWSYLVAGVALIAVCAAIYEWTSGVPGMWKLSLGPPTRDSFMRLVRSYFCASFCLAPAVAWAVLHPGSRRRSRPRAAAVVAAGAALGLGLLADRGSGLWVGNNIDPRGVGGTLLLGGGRPVLVAAALWHLVAAASIVSGMALAGCVAAGRARPVLGGAPPAPDGGPGTNRRDWSDPVSVFEAFSLLLLAGLAVYVLAAPKLFDRYLWTVVFAGGVLLLRIGPARNSRRTRAAGRSRGRLLSAVLIGGITALVTLVAAVLTVNSDAYDAARWQAGEWLSAHGTPPARADAGFEWVGAHATGPVDLARQALPFPAFEPWYAQMEPRFRDCAVVSGTPLDLAGVRLLAVRRYRPLGVAGSARLYLYGVTAPGC